MASGNRIFLDSNVVLDHVADRQPFSEYAHRLFALAETGELALFVSALSFSNLYYVLRKLRGHSDALFLLRKLEQLISVTTVGESEVQAAFPSSFKDFEDALQYFSAKAVGGIDAIVTRNESDFESSEIPVYSPEAFLTSREKREK